MTGGAAFPCQFLGIDRGQLSYEYTENQEGMSLRDYFAIHATSDDILTFQREDCPETGAMKRCFTREVARYRFADAMLKAREAK